MDLSWVQGVCRSKEKGCWGGGKDTGLSPERITQFTYLPSVLSGQSKTWQVGDVSGFLTRFCIIVYLSHDPGPLPTGVALSPGLKQRDYSKNDLPKPEAWALFR